MIGRGGADEADLGAEAVPTFDDLFRREYPGLVRLAGVLVDDRAEAEEVVQEAFARLLVKGAGIDNPGAYLQRAVVNRSRDVLRRRAVRRRYQPEPPGAVGEHDHLLDAVRRLPARRRAVVVLRFYEDLTVDQIATTLGMRAGTVKSDLHRAMQQLRTVVEQ